MAAGAGAKRWAGASPLSSPWRKESMSACDWKGVREVRVLAAGDVLVFGGREGGDLEGSLLDCFFTRRGGGGGGRRDFVLELAARVVVVVVVGGLLSWVSTLRLFFSGAATSNLTPKKLSESQLFRLGASGRVSGSEWERSGA